MKRSSRLQKLVDINRRFESMAIATLVSARELNQMQEDQLKLLRTYRDEYRNQLDQLLKSTRSANEIRDYHQFISSIDDAIAQQELEVAKSAKQLETSESNWLEKRFDVKKMEKATNNVREHELLTEQVREQKEIDELFHKPK